ncbi:MAG: formate dehydrogenase subunit gamma [Terriglobales bacterium]
MASSSRTIERFDDKARETFEHAGRTTVYRGELLRHSVYDRVLHWSIALFFFLALFSGFGIYLPWLFRWFTPIFGGGQLSRIMHPYFGVAFVFFFSLQVLNWFQLMLWAPGDTRWMRSIKAITSGEEKMDPPETGFFNAGQKVMFWEIIAGCIVYIITGTILWAGAKTFGGTAVAISYVLHDISALIMLGGIFIHIYQSTIGEPGTFQAMIRGAVSEAWAWTFHPSWYKEVTGRDAQEACDEVRRKLYGDTRQAQPAASKESAAAGNVHAGVIPAEIRGRQYISLATFRKSGAAVYTPVWFAEADDKIYFMTSSKTGKYKRIRNNPQVKIAACTMSGKITGPEFAATARILPPADFARVRQMINRKYWLARVPFLWRNTDTCLEITPG